MIVFRDNTLSIEVVQERGIRVEIVGRLIKPKPDGDWILEAQEEWTGFEALDMYEKRHIVWFLDKLNGWDHRPIEMIRGQWEKITGRDTYRDR